MIGQLSLDLELIPVVEADHRDFRRPRHHVYYRPMRMGADRVLEYVHAITPDTSVDPLLWLFEAAQNPGRTWPRRLSDKWRRVATLNPAGSWL